MNQSQRLNGSILYYYYSRHVPAIKAVHQKSIFWVQNLAASLLDLVYLLMFDKSNIYLRLL